MRRIRAAAVTSLAWDGDDLVDVVGGWRRWQADGTATPSRVSWAYPFDRAVVSPSGRFRVIYAERGTKALLLDHYRVSRELNRSFYHAADYDYPVTLARLPDGREVVVHCPERYNQIEIEDAVSGQRLTGGERRPIDVFHSRLAVSPDGGHLLTAGWLWHPYGIGRVFDLPRALADPSTLDSFGTVALDRAVNAEVAAACWLDTDRVAMATTTEESLGDEEPDALGPGQLGIWSNSAGTWQHRTTVTDPPGAMIGCGDRILALHTHPQLLDPATASVIAEWPDVTLSPRAGSYGVTHVPTPVVALHPDQRRLAVAQPEHIVIIDLPGR